MNIICGIDEAGRGPVIGPMVMTICGIDKSSEFKLKALGVKDSKLLTEKKRLELFDIINDLCFVKSVVISPQEIDASVNSPDDNLNFLEAKKSAFLIDSLLNDIDERNVESVVLDCPSTNISAYEKTMYSLISVKTRLIVEHKADLNYVIAGAASIIAKTIRDREILKLKEIANYDFGSGYPSDVKTVNFVADNFDKFDFFRTSWSTFKNARAKKEQFTLDSFSNNSLSNKQEDGLSKKNVGLMNFSKDVLNKKHLLLKIFSNLESVSCKNVSEVLRLKGEGITITLYTTKKILFQGKNKDKFEQMFNKQNLK